MRIMNYKGYSAPINYSDEDGLFVGHVSGLKDVIGFHGHSIQEVHRAFEEAVDDYLDVCERMNSELSNPI